MLNDLSRKKIIIAAAAGALALTAGLVLLFTRCGNLGPAPKYAVIYEKGSRNLFAALPEGSFRLRAEESLRQVFAGQYLYYDAVTNQGTDIYVMNMRDSRSRKEGGTLAAQGVGAEWTVTADGRRAAWVLSRGSVLTNYDAQRGTSDELASGVEALYAEAGQDVFFFTKAEGELFRCNLRQGQRPERVAGDVRDVRFFGGQAVDADDDSPAGEPVVYYLQPAGESLDLYAMGREGGAVLVAQNPVKMLFENYEPGGNLYFLKRGEAGSLSIDDPYAETDAAMKEPQGSVGRGGRISNWLAGVLGANTLSGRQRAAYEEKLERDAVRAAVAAAMENLPNSVIPLDCWIYDGTSARLLARGVREDHIALVRSAGRPAMLYEKLQGEESGGEGVFSMDTLVEAYRAGGAEAVGEALISPALGAEDAGYALAMMSADGPSEIFMGLDFGSGAGWDAWFLPGTETMLYRARDVEGGLYALYSYELTGYGLSERIAVDLDTEEVAVAAGGVYYSKKEADAKGIALYYCASDGKAQRVMRGAGTFFSAGKCLLAFDGTDKLFRVNGASFQLLDSGVRLEGVRTGSANACWFTQWEAGTGTLRLADVSAKGNGGAVRTLDTGVTTVRTVQ